MDKHLFEVSKVKLRKWGLKCSSHFPHDAKSLLVSKVKLRKWGLKSSEFVSFPIFSRFQRSNSENEDWNMCSNAETSISYAMVSKVKLRKWGLKWTMKSIFTHFQLSFQRSNSENEDWNYPSILSHFLFLTCFKGQTQKMRIEIIILSSHSSVLSNVSKVKLRKWGLKYDINK